MFKKFVKKANSSVKSMAIVCAAHCDYFVH